MASEPPLFGCSLFGRNHQTNRSASPVKRYLRCVLINISLYISIVVYISICIALYTYIFQYPFTIFFFMYSEAVFSAKHGETALSVKSSKGERSNVYVGLAATTPHYGCRTHFGLRLHKIHGSFFGDGLLPSPLVELWILFRFATCPWRPFSKSASSVKPGIHCRHWKCQRVCRREVGMTRLNMFSVQCLCCIIGYLKCWHMLVHLFYIRMSV